MSQFCSKPNSLYCEDTKNCLWSFNATFSVLDKFFTLLQRNATFDLEFTYKFNTIMDS